MKKILFIGMMMFAIILQAQEKTYLENVKLSCPDNNHPHAIDLGLPSGFKWACCNVGASKPEDYGDHFAWGETKAKKIYDWKTYVYGGGKELHLPQLSPSNSIICSEYDVAHIKWGNNWVIPHLSRFGELVENCTCSWTIINDVEGCVLTSKINGNNIFIPLAGYRNGVTWYFKDDGGHYWTCDDKSCDLGEAYYILFSYKGSTSSYQNYKYGLSVRPIMKEINISNTLCPDNNHPHLVDLGLPSGTKWACCNLGADEPLQMGDFFSWGETESKDEYLKTTYSLSGQAASLGREVLRNDVTYKDIAGTIFDAASKQWGLDWKMPSLFECKELIENTKQVFYEMDEGEGKGGVKFIGNNGNSIVIPNSGIASGNHIHLMKDGFNIWSSTRNDKEGLFLSMKRQNNKINMVDLYVWYGVNIRAVGSFTK